MKIKKRSVSSYGKWVYGLISDFLGQSDMVFEFEKEDEFDDANYLFINF